MKDRRQIGFEALCLAFGLFAGASASAQILNPGFETAGTTSALAANWTVDQAAGGPVYGVRTNDNPHSGSYNFEVHLASVGAGPVVEFEQTGVPVTGGTTNSFTFYADALAGSAGYNAQWRILWNTGGDTGYQSYAPSNNSYAVVSNSIIAPSAATSATLFFHFAGAASDSQSATIDLDDVSLASTNSAGGGGGGGGGSTNQFSISIVPGMGISWFASNSITYQVQWASNLTASWNNLGSAITGNGSSNTVFDPAGQSHNAYQVLSIH